MSAPDLDDPDYARFAWRRYRQLLGWVALAAALAVVGGIEVLRVTTGPMPLLAMIFSGGGIFFTILLAGALMGLVFLSSGSGHDDKIEDPTRTGDE